MRHLKSLVLILSSAVLLAACSSPVKLDDKQADVVDHSTGASADPRSVNPVNTGSADPLNDPQGVLSKRSIYFDFDSYTVKDEFRSVIEAHAQYLNSHRGRKILVQGNTDARGGAEYNLALGQKRAEAVRRALTLLGVSDTQIEAVSLGKEKPTSTGSDEDSYAQNRRADIVYQ